MHTAIYWTAVCILLTQYLYSLNPSAFAQDLLAQLDMFFVSDHAHIAYWLPGGWYKVLQLDSAGKHVLSVTVIPWQPHTRLWYLSGGLSIHFFNVKATDIWNLHQRGFFIAFFKVFSLLHRHRCSEWFIFSIQHSSVVWGEGQNLDSLLAAAVLYKGQFSTSKVSELIMNLSAFCLQACFLFVFY